MQLIQNYSLKVNNKYGYSLKKTHYNNYLVEKETLQIMPSNSYNLKFKNNNSFKIPFRSLYHSELLNEATKLTNKKELLIYKIIDSEINIAQIRKKQLKICEELKKIENNLIVKRSLLDEKVSTEAEDTIISGLNNRIGGYLNAKDKIKTNFIEKLFKSKNTPDVPMPNCIPNCIILDGISSDTKTFFEGIKDSTKDLAQVVDISNIKFDENISVEINKILEDAKSRYLKEGKRTIIFMDSAEKILSINKSEEKIFGIKLDNEDKKNLDVIGNKKDLISYFKSLLDNVSNIPDENNPYGSSSSATTFIMATRNPHLIHPDLISRSGKMNTISIDLPSDKNLEDVIKFHFNETNKILSGLKKLKENINFKEEIDKFAGISDKAKNNIKKLIQDDSINKLRVDFDYIPESLIEALNPNPIEGAFSNKKLQLVIQEAFNNYLEKGNKKEDIRVFIIRELLNSQRDISPQEYKKICKIRKMFNKNEINLDSIESLLLQKKMGLLSEESSKQLKDHIEKINYEIKILEKLAIKGQLNEDQLKRKKELDTLMLKINKIDKLKR